MTRMIDNERPVKERDEYLRETIQRLIEEVHDLLDAPDGNIEMQKVVLTLPRAFVELAAFLAVVEEDDPASLGFWEYVKMTPDDGMAVRHLNRMRNDYLERRIDEAMHLTLHLLASGALELRGKRGL
ncbi:MULTISPECIES: hypothetical protein [unclassified Mameliella]|uniref:hypothetical protein n=1 Tax=unclassified Mameliella TaxID=2630630 RepID=UPI0027401E2F|nr:MULTISPECIES: hypothetical protein [unclassified Mameliella]